MYLHSVKYLKIFCFILFRILLKWRIEDINNIGGISPWKRKRKKKYISANKTIHSTTQKYVLHIPVTSYIFCVWVLSAPITVIQAKCCLFVESFDQKLTETKSRNISWCLAQRCWYNTSKYAFNQQCKGIFFELFLDSVFFYKKKKIFIHANHWFQ